MDPSRKRAIRLTVALTAALLLATALIYVSFTAGRDELTAAQLMKQAQPGGHYIVAGTVEDGSVKHAAGGIQFKILSPDRKVAVPVSYSGIVPDPFAAGRAVLLNVNDSSGKFVGQQNSLTTKCPSKYQAASAAE